MTKNEDRELTIDVAPVLNEQRNVLLFDLYLEGCWVGSRRAVNQCEAWLSYLTDREIATVPDNPW